MYRVWFRVLGVSLSPRAILLSHVNLVLKEELASGKNNQLYVKQWFSKFDLRNLFEMHLIRSHPRTLLWDLAICVLTSLLDDSAIPGRLLVKLVLLCGPCYASHLPSCTFGTACHPLVVAVLYSS